MLAVALTSALAALAPHPARAQASNQPAGWDASLRLREAVDINPAPDIVEINLDAVVAKVDLGNGQSVEAWTYNGGLPGPLIRTKVGDRLIVHFTNHLPAPTTVHWHGLRVPIEMDGVPGISQPPVLKGEHFTYSFTVPDAGLFWYHPHVSSAEQVGFGLAGPLLVEDPAEKARLGFSEELVIVLSDIGVDEQGKLDDPNSGGTTGMAFGREGNVVLINGKVGTGALTVRSGAPQRWRIVNVAKSRFFAIDLDGQPFTKIGSDGGLTAAPTTETNIVVGCGERLDLIVSPKGAPGSELQFRSYVFNRGYGSVEFRPAEEPLFMLKFADLPAYAGPAPAPISRPVPPISPDGATKTTMNFTITQLQDGTFQYGINGKPHWATTPFTAKIGETQIWTLVNKTPWSHPFHLH
ncbi:MAG: multicopper oxidase family protein, partial [Vicinamibacterales bacterium]